MASVEDATLLSRAQAGDVEAFETLVSQSRDQVYGVALRMTRSEADAAEITQEVFLSAFQHLKEFRGDAAFSSWLHRIAANFALMRLRHRKVANEQEAPLEQPDFNERGSLIDEVADFSKNAEGQSLDAELNAAIEQATAALPEDHRRVFLLKDVEGLSYEEISDLTGESVAAIKSRLHRARLALRATINRFYQEQQ